MKLIKWIVIPIVLLIAIGFGAYHFGVDYAINKASEKLESSGKMEEIKELVKNDPELSAFIKEVETLPEAQSFLTEIETQASASTAVKEKEIPAVSNQTGKTSSTGGETLPIQTKEEAIEVVVDRVGIPKLTSMAQRFNEGSATKEELLAEVSNQFTEEELTALKIIAYKELYGSK